LKNQGKVANVALIDNGNSLTDNLGVVEKCFKGPREGQVIDDLNRERLQRFIDDEQDIRARLKLYLVDPKAMEGLFARAKALLARGTYGNFQPAELNAHLPPEMHLRGIIDTLDKSQ
jgi:hypothetical protein